ncbi:ImmA/IrrE family metallo-endopeptidase [Mesorhizobium sp. M0119]|uniref:ImmA/IrrE family metallo-endopeptidase n=1 Tax=Mesorhizobium sp. M0119 TaxID=2956885 RepID=UPI003335483A
MAHELGHIARGHLPQTEGGAIIDAEVTSDSSAGSQEDEANSFALSVLTPFKGIRIASSVPKSPELAEAAIKFGKANKPWPRHSQPSA